MKVAVALFPGLNVSLAHPSFQELFREIDVKYKEALSPQHTRLLSAFLNEAGLDTFLLELHEMIVLKLRGPQTEDSFNPRWRYAAVLLLEASPRLDDSPALQSKTLFVLTFHAFGTL